MAPRDEDSLHPIAPVLRARANRPIQVPARTRTTVPLPGGWPGGERRRWKRPRPAVPQKEATPETYDQAGHVRPAHPEPEPDHLDEEA